MNYYKFRVLFLPRKTINPKKRKTFKDALKNICKKMHTFKALESLVKVSA